MMQIRKADDRGTVRTGWLDSRHTFSFGHYYDPAHMGFGALRVINEDRVEPGQGFAPHGHEDMEIVSYVIDGALEHEDSMGNGSVIRPGDVQRMTAGTGVRHSEFNHSPDEPVHFLQIWILPEATGLAPGYEEKHFPVEEKRNRLKLIGSRDGRLGSLRIHQDVDLYASVLSPGTELKHPFGPGRKGWLQIVRGTVALGEHTLGAGDGVAVEGRDALELTATDDTELLLFDIA